MTTVSRQVLLDAGETFVRRIVLVHGVERIALIGSITTDKTKPKDIDFLLTVSVDIDMKAAASEGRKLKGFLQGHGSGADVFLCNANHQYIGRTCGYRECQWRAACEGTDCRPGAWLKTDFHLVKLSPALCKNPPLVIWPVQRVTVIVPEDVAQMLRHLELELGRES